MIFKKIVKLLCCFIVWIQDFIKKLRYLKSKISTKFHRLLFFSIFLAFLAFSFVFHLSKLVQHLWNFLWWFIGRVREFTSDFWKILKVLLKNYWYEKYSFFSKFYGLLFVFYFFIIFDILFFNFVYFFIILFFIFLLFLTFYFMD